jgi:hypothetical protein
MTTLDQFLSTTDLDDLLSAYRAMESLSPKDVASIERVIVEWRDHQAVANLLFYPQMIPEPTRLQAVDRALRSDDYPYLQLAATVGLQGLDYQDLPAERRSAWLASLAAFLDSSATVLASRASVVLYGWAVEGDELAARAIGDRYPVADHNISRNMLAALLFLYGAHSGDDLTRRLQEWQIPEDRRGLILKAHEEHVKLAAEDTRAAEWQTYPLFSYIPNLTESEQYGLTGVAAPRQRVWWRLWR